MAKLSGPLLSKDAHGSIGPRLTFSSRRSGSQVRFQRAQKDYTTAARTKQREFFQKAMGWWKQLTPPEQAEWRWEGDNP